MGEAADTLLHAGARLFAQRGYEGASVRAICEAAGANVNAISYHFGGKQGLYDAVLGHWSGKQTTSAERILGRPPADLRDLETRLLLFTEETLAAYMAHPEWLIICAAEFQQGFRNCDDSASVKKAMRGPIDVIVAFLQEARQRNILRENVDAAVIAGSIMERINNQVLYADTIQSMFGDSIKSSEYLRYWSQQVIDLLVHGIAR
ncbi:MAG: helix-turn-helix transcriptional regulator [Nannocystaceae bacterium]|nr:helix-turn-helix transcriptional regulator [Nannocystaceae bacterium]